MARRRRNPPDLYHHTTAEKAARIYREQRLRSAGEPDVYVTTADYDIGYGPVAVPIYVPAKMLQLDDEFPDGRKDYRVKLSRPGGSVPVYAGKPFPVRKPNPAGDVVYIPQEVLDRQPTGHVTYDHRGDPRILVDPGTGEAPTWRRVALLNRVVTATARHRAGDSWYMANYEWHTGPERLYGQPRSAWAPFVYGRTGYRDFAVGEQPVAFIRAALAATRAYDRVNRKTDDPGQSTRAASEAYHRTARVLAGRKLNPAGRLLQFPLREIRVEAFPSPLSSGWLLRLHINGQDVKDAVRDIKTGQARVFDSSAKAAAWWKKHGQAFVDAMGRAACVRTRKANPRRLTPAELAEFASKDADRRAAAISALVAWYDKGDPIELMPEGLWDRLRKEFIPSAILKELDARRPDAHDELRRRSMAHLAQQLAAGRPIYQGQYHGPGLLNPPDKIGAIYFSTSHHVADYWSVRRGRQGWITEATLSPAATVATVDATGKEAGSEPGWIREQWRRALENGADALVLYRITEAGYGGDTVMVRSPEVVRVRTRETNRSGGRQQAVGGRKKQSRRAGWRGGCSVLEPVYSVRARRSVRSVEKPRRRANPKTRLEDYLRSQARGKAARRLPSEIAKLRREIGDKRAARSRQRYGSLGHGRYDWDYGPAALRRRLAVRREKAKLDAFVRQWTGCPASRYWSASDLDKVRKEAQYESRGIGGDVAAAAARATIAAMVRRMVKRGWTLRHTSRDGGRATSRYLRKGDFEVRLSDHRVPETAEREYRGPARWWDFEELNPCADVEAQIMYIEAHREGRTPNPKSKIRNPKSSSPFAAEVARLRTDPTLQSASMRQHLRNVAKAPGSGRPRRSAAAREWKEFAGYEPNHVEKIDGVALKGNLPGVRVDVLEGVGAETGRRVKIDAGQKPLYLVWFKSGERFAVTGGPSAMRELARDFSRLNEPIYLTKVDYVAPRYPVPEGVRRTKANAELSIAFTHAVENPTLMTWNGKLDPRHARFDIRVKGRRRRWVNRSGLIF